MDPIILACIIALIILLNLLALYKINAHYKKRDEEYLKQKEEFVLQKSEFEKNQSTLMKAQEDLQNAQVLFEKEKSAKQDLSTKDEKEIITDLYI